MGLRRWNPRLFELFCDGRSRVRGRGGRFGDRGITGNWVRFENLGQDYIVWDKSANIRFRKPGKGTVSAAFRLSDQQIDDLRRELQTREKIEPAFSVVVTDETGTVIAEVEKILHIRKKAGS